MSTGDTHYMNECIIFEVSLKNKKGYTVSLYKSPSQSHHVFGDFLFNFDQLLSKGLQIESVTSSYGLTGHFLI